MSLRFVVLAALASLVLAACGAPSGDVVKPTSSTSSPMSAAAAPKGG